MTSLLRSTRLRSTRALASFAVWIAIALLVGLHEVIVRQATALAGPGSLPANYLLLGLWAAATPAILRSAARWPVRSGMASAHLARHAAHGGLFIGATNLLIRLPRALVEPGFDATDLLTGAGHGIAVYGPGAVVAYAAIVAIGHALAAPTPETPTAEPGEVEPSRRSYLTLREGESKRVVPVDRIEWIEADDNYVRVAAGSEVHRVRMRMSEVESRLEPRQFVRVHRSAIVPVDRVRSVVPRIHGDWTVELASGREFAVARGRRKALEEAITRLGGGLPNDQTGPGRYSATQYTIRGSSSGARTNPVPGGPP